jgi:hypothetical protein
VAPVPGGEVNLFGASLAVELTNHATVEAGGAAVGSAPGGEVGLYVGAHAWARFGWAPVLYRSVSERGWEFQLAPSIGYRYLEWGKIVYEDYGVDTERVHALALEVGPVATHVSDGGPNFSIRLLSGVVLPIARSHTRANSADYPLGKLQYAIPVGLELGLAFR